jgi:cation transport ATPase
MIGSVSSVVRYRTAAARVPAMAPGVLLALTVAGLAAGGALRLAGDAEAGIAAWTAVSACGLAFATWTMAESVRRRRVGVDLIALLALAGAMAVGELLAAAVITVMLTSGRALEGWAAGRARRDLSGLLEHAPRTAVRYRGDGLETVPVDEILPGDSLLVRRGEAIPADGTVQSGHAVLDESALTGEPAPVERSAGDPVRSGAVNAGEPLRMLATASAADSTYAGIVRLVEEAGQSQAPFVRLADRYAVWFLFLSLGAASIAWAAAGAGRAVAVLVVATPCPLILAAPVALVSGMSVAARRGVVIKGAGVLSTSPAAPRCCWTRPARSRRAARPCQLSSLPDLFRPPRCCRRQRPWIRHPGMSWPPQSSAPAGSAATSSICPSWPTKCPVTASAARSLVTRSGLARRTGAGSPGLRRRRPGPRQPAAERVWTAR